MKLCGKSFAFYVLIFSSSLLACSFTLAGCGNKKIYIQNRIAMGTFVEVISPDKEAAGIVFKEISRIEDLLSKYKDNSEVAVLNKTGQIKASLETAYVIKKSMEFYKLSNGAFDITVAPLLELWGFKNKDYALPKEAEIKKMLGVVGTDKIIFNENDNVVKFSVYGMKIDLGAIAKGYSIDCAVKKLKEKGIKSCLINAGGQVYCLGDKFGRPWNVAIQNPRKDKVMGRFALKNRAVATSGDYEQFFLKGNKRYSHIFNPKTGYPADSGVISVTVIADDSLTADALSTAIFVLGKVKGELLAKKFPNVEVKIIEEKDIKL